jgi:hypothetical protein
LWQKKFDHTTKYTKITKVIYFILLLLRDLGGKNKTDLFFGSGPSASLRSAGGRACPVSLGWGNFVKKRFSQQKSPGLFCYYLL